MFSENKSLFGYAKIRSVKTVLNLASPTLTGLWALTIAAMLVTAVCPPAGPAILLGGVLMWCSAG